MPYPQDSPERGVPASPSFPRLEERVLDFWSTNGTFARSVAAREPGTDGDNEYVFYDGPPFANGLPHYGHLFTGYVKDVVPRYQTMRGRRVERRFGWDCHGLPAEVEAEKQLGISTKGEILDLGIEKFNEACRTSVLRYTRDWERYVTRQARWVDFDNDYKTLDLDYMESVMWAFKTLYDKGLIYEGFRVLAYCWRCETPLSNTETRMDDVYRDRQDPASTVWFELETGERMLAWTTMPWTLVPNVALVVGPDIDYAVMEQDGHRYVLAEARLDAYQKELAGARKVATVKGREFVGRRYTPLFEFLVDQMADAPAAFTVLAGDFVSTEDGTGIVQVAPSHGEDDYNVCTEAGIPVVLTVDEQTRFTSVAPRFEGLQVFEANKPLLRELRERGHLVRQDSYVHPYPHCWRCDTPLVYKAVSSWFVAVTKFKDRMVELNQEINWVPGHVKDGSFGKWLANARDWSISRNRFWGSPIPVWKSDDPAYPRLDVYGSLEQLESDFGELASRSDEHGGELASRSDKHGGVKVDDLHRPGVDELTRPNPDDPTGKSTMRRVPEVLDCWFESGSMPFAQVHYPFENRDWFEHHYPGDFIVEYIGQTRGWFYTLHVLATALFDRPAFRNCVSHGILLGSDGRKMSKSLRNYPDVYEMYDSYGADAMRWYLMSAPVIRGGDMSVTESGVRDAVRHVINPLWNVWYFFSLYANAEGYTAKARSDHGSAGSALPAGPEVPASPEAAVDTGVAAGAEVAAGSAGGALLDRYVLAKTRELVETVTAEMDEYDISGACEAVRSYLDALTNWYVRRSRDRFWSGEHAAFDSLYTVLETLCRVAAPLLPMVSEDIWRGLTGGESAKAPSPGREASRESAPSVHLTDWPDAASLPEDHDLVAAMDATREVCSAALSLRKTQGLRVRLPLRTLTVATPDAARLRAFADLVADEVNVKQVVFTDRLDDYCEQVLTVVPRVLGPRLGKDVQTVIRAVKAGEWSVAPSGEVTAGGFALQPGEYDLKMVARQADRSAPLGDQGVVVLDTEVTSELATEGLARDLVRVVQLARREADFDVADRIRLVVEATPEVTAAVQTHREFVSRETLAVAVEFGAATESGFPGTVGDDVPVYVAVSRA